MDKETEEKWKATENKKPILPTNRQEKKEFSDLTVFLVVLFYFVVSISIVFLNKYILSVSEYKFPYPIFITWYQLVVALVILIVCGFLGKSVPIFSIVPPYEFRLDIAQSVLPLTLIYIFMLSLNNLCLKYVEVTFYQVARSLSIFFNIVLTYTILGKDTSRQATFSCFVVFLGFVIGSYGEVNFTWEGVIYGVGSSLFVALYGIYVKKKLSILDNNEWRLLHYNTTIAVILFLPVIYISGELDFMHNPEVNFLDEPGFWFIMTVTAVAGFLINIAMFLQIKVTSPLTNTISGTAKACVQTLLGWLIFRNEISGMNGFGIFLSLLGTGMYSWFRYAEMNK